MPLAPPPPHTHKASYGLVNCNTYNIFNIACIVNISDLIKSILAGTLTTLVNFSHPIMASSHSLYILTVKHILVCLLYVPSQLLFPCTTIY